MQEAYEDAMFALLMDYVAESEGKKAIEENEALRQDPDAAVPEEVRKACMKEIGRSFRKSSARSMGRFTMKVVNKVAIVALVGGILFSTAFAASEEFRVNTLNMLIDTVNEGVSFRISSQLVSEHTDLEDLRPGFVPEGYELEDEGSFAGDYWVYYQNEQGDRLDIDIMTTGSSTMIDTEGAEIEPIEVCGIPAYLIDQTKVSGDKHGNIKVIVPNEEQGYLLNVTSTLHSATAPVIIDREKILDIVESIYK